MGMGAGVTGGGVTRPRDQPPFCLIGWRWAVCVNVDMMHRTVQDPVETCELILARNAQKRTRHMVIAP